MPALEVVTSSRARTISCAGLTFAQSVQVQNEMLSMLSTRMLGEPALVGRE
jgi:hypothetical protein